MTKPLTAKQRNNRRAMARIAARLRAANIAEVESLMTPKQRVMAKYPKAWAVYVHREKMAYCYREYYNLISMATTLRQAWANAAANLSKGRK